MLLQVKIKHVYGKKLVVPACAKSEIFCQLLGQLSLTGENIEQIKSLGFSFQVVNQDTI